MNPFAHIRTHSFQGKRFQIRWRKPAPKTHGQCDDPSTPNKVMYIDRTLNPADLLETVVHEGLHASFFMLDENSTEQAAEDIARLLRRMGYQLLPAV